MTTRKGLLLISNKQMSGMLLNPTVVHGIFPLIAKNYLSQNINSAEVEKASIAL
jgi:hypothetical protein